ncbi:guanine nucleotide exchange factor MON1 Ecym_3058 [Eremothecium cymbalariae DBVPG|uniref:Vacuolar fusion protein MON1 n=1 Tax=Eremothecium cymbalariae (strain CBS 270.75 / DBVPG 7215 / KCTC 17166 / NRRL Y-17582) TaxID=931890 RepID=G8JR01_ERECY|nr:Hypothetical protein Ecym_3058 [Eremothecium cymbalariae DBVPG\
MHRAGSKEEGRGDDHRELASQQQRGGRRLRSVASLTSLKSLSPPQTMNWPISKATISVDLTNHFTSTLVRSSLADQESLYERLSPSPQNVEPNVEGLSSEAMTYDLLSIQDELTHSLHSVAYVPLRELPNPFRRTVENCKELPQGKQFLILTSAGKPIYSMNGQDEYVMGLMGIVHTIINYFQLSGQKECLKTITTFDTNGVLQKFTFLNKRHVVLLAMTNYNETDLKLQQQLDLLYSYLISTLSLRQLNRLFNKRENFDLRSHLTGSDFHNLDQLCQSICLGKHPGWMLGALECVTLKKSIRQRIHTIMLQSIRDLPVGALLYGIIMAPDHRLVSVMRPKGHTLHTTDLQLLFSMVENQLQFLDSNQEVWVPVCFPKFNGNGFLYCYFKFLPPGFIGTANNYGNATTLEGNERVKPTLILISPQKNSFYELQQAANTMTDNLTISGILPHITNPSRFTINDIPAPLVHHFIYKSKKYVQYVMPETSSVTDWSTLMKYYSHLKSAVFDNNGTPLNKTVLSFVRWSALSDEDRPPKSRNNELLLQEDLNADSREFFIEEGMDMFGMAWFTPSFELYLVCNNGAVDRNMILKSARNISRWCKLNEHRLFVSDSAVF